MTQMCRFHVSIMYLALPSVFPDVTSKLEQEQCFSPADNGRAGIAGAPGAALLSPRSTRLPEGKSRTSALLLPDLSSQEVTDGRFAAALPISPYSIRTRAC